MRPRTPRSAIIAIIAITACTPYVNEQNFLYDVDAWEPEDGHLVYRRFVDDVDFPGVPEEVEWRLHYGFFLQQAIDEGATRSAITFSGASLAAPDLASPGLTPWAGQLELWAESESGAAHMLGTAALSAGDESAESLVFPPLDLDLMDVSGDFESGAFDLVLRGPRDEALDTLPPLKLLVSFKSEAHRGL